MTTTFDRNALAAPNLFQNAALPTDLHPRDLRVEQVGVKFVRSAVVTGHYSGSMPDATKECFAGFYGDALAGVVVFGMGCNNAQYTAQGHYGYIYQALNFLYLGMTTAGSRYETQDGQEVHGRLLGIYRIRRPEFSECTGPEIAASLGWRKVASAAKHRYVLLLGDKRRRKRMRRALLSEPQPYPKADTDAEDAPKPS